MKRIPTSVLLPALLVALTAVAVAARAQTDPLSPEGEVMVVEERRTQAMVDADVPALESLLADQLRFTHANGNVESKYQVIAALESKNLDYQSIETSGVVVRVYGSAAVVAGTAKVRLVELGERRRVDLVYTAVYARSEEGDWQLVAYQSTRSPSPPAS